jgi:hypothetical protein
MKYSVLSKKNMWNLKIATILSWNGTAGLCWQWWRWVVVGAEVVVVEEEGKEDI